MEEYDQEYIDLQTELVRLQQYVKSHKLRVAILFEGRDTAGKGGAIMRFIRFLNPRFIRVVALSKPTKQEKGQWYFQRYIKHLPDEGEIVFFDRSWYNRAVVEPVMGFCTKKEYKQFIDEVQLVENMLVNDGIKIFKFWFSIKQQEQEERLKDRVINPLKQWKLSTVDSQAQAKWDDYTFYKNEMFKHTSTVKVPWIVINGNDHDLARKEAMKFIINSINFPEKGQTGIDLKTDEGIISIQKTS